MFYRDALLKGRDILSSGERCEQQDNSKGPEYAVFHRTSKGSNVLAWTAVFGQPCLDGHI
jgi:hypothetical protein